MIPAGAPVADRLTICWNEFEVETDTVAVPDASGANVSVVGLVETVKSEATICIETDTPVDCPSEVPVMATANVPGSALT